jgi:hypothetical protein
MGKVGLYGDFRSATNQEKQDIRRNKKIATK